MTIHPGGCGDIPVRGKVVELTDGPIMSTSPPPRGGERLKTPCVTLRHGPLATRGPLQGASRLEALACTCDSV